MAELSTEADKPEHVANKRVRVEWDCVNPICDENDRDNLVTAQRFDRDFFGVKDDPKKKRKICSKCRNKADKERRR